MYIKALIMASRGTLVTALPCGTMALQEQLMSVGILQTPNSIPLTDNEKDSLRVKLYGANELGNHLVTILSEQDTLADAENLTFLVSKAMPEIRNDLARNILMDNYKSKQELVDGIHALLQAAGPIKEVFYCPIVGNLDEGAGDLFTVRDSFLLDYDWAIRDALDEAQDISGAGVISEFSGSPSVKEKLTSVRWGIEDRNGTLLCRIDCRLKEPLTAEETESLRAWLCSQNESGFGARFERHIIETEDGDLSISLWNNGSDYAVRTQDEQEDLESEMDITMGGM